MFQHDHWYVFVFMKADETEPFLDDYQRDVGNETDLVVYRLFTRSVKRFIYFFNI